MTSFFDSYWSKIFWSFAWLCFWSHLTCIAAKNNFLPRNLIFFTWIPSAMVKWMCVTLIQAYLRAANRRSKKLYRFFKSKYDISAFNKIIFLLCFLLSFWDCKSTNLMKLSSGNLSAMFWCWELFLCDLLRVCNVCVVCASVSFNLYYTYFFLEFVEGILLLSAQKDGILWVQTVQVIFSHSYKFQKLMIITRN